MTFPMETVESGMPSSIYRDSKGTVVSTEFVLIVAISITAMVVGWSEVAIALNSDFNLPPEPLNMQDALIQKEDAEPTGSE